MKVLLAADGSDAATRAAETLASLVRAGDTDVRVLVVVSYSFYPYMEGDPDEDAKAARERAAHEAEVAPSEKVVPSLELAGHRVTVVRRYGNPTDEIVREIEDWDPNLVVLGRRGLRGARAWLGSVSEHVLHHAKVPVLLVP